MFFTTLETKWFIKTNVGKMVYPKQMIHLYSGRKVFPSKQFVKQQSVSCFGEIDLLEVS